MSLKRSIKSVAIIGGGPAGIACVNELIHVSADGVSSLEKNIKPKIPAFDKVVCFEQNSKLGGVWNFFNKPDPTLPPLDILNRGGYSKPDKIYEKPVFPTETILSNATYERPFVKLSNKTLSDELRWHRNAAYKDLFTNIPEKFMRFSYTTYRQISKGKFLAPLVSSVQIRDYLSSIIEKFDLQQYFRLNSGVEQITKIKNSDGDEKWLLTIRQKSPFSKVEQWYTEEFDAVIAANGHCNVPFIPEIDGLTEFVKRFPKVIRHSKSFRDASVFKNSKVLLCGSGTSSADLAQYISPVAKGVTISQRSQTVYGWIKECFDGSPEIKFRPRISKYLYETGEVQFDDGTIDKFDHIILSTGYHYHYPFIKENDEYVKIYSKHDSHGPISKIGNLYLYTFSTLDNTFATVGIPTIGLMFHAMEYSAAAIAGVFSGSKQLPKSEEQNKWNDSRTKIAEPEVPHRYQGFFIDKVEDQLLTPLMHLAPNGRSNPLQTDKWNPREVDESNAALVKAFFALKSGKYNSQDLLK